MERQPSRRPPSSNARYDLRDGSGLLRHSFLPDTRDQRHGTAHLQEASRPPLLELADLILGNVFPHPRLCYSVVGSQSTMGPQYFLHHVWMVGDGHLSELGPLLEASPGDPQPQHPPGGLDPNRLDYCLDSDPAMGNHMGFH